MSAEIEQGGRQSAPLGGLLGAGVAIHDGLYDAILGPGAGARVREHYRRQAAQADRIARFERWAVVAVLACLVLILAAFVVIAWRAAL